MTTVRTAIRLLDDGHALLKNPTPVVSVDFWTDDSSVADSLWQHLLSGKHTQYLGRNGNTLHAFASSYSDIQKVVSFLRQQNGINLELQGRGKVTAEDIRDAVTNQLSNLSATWNLQTGSRGLKDERSMLLFDD